MPPAFRQRQTSMYNDSPDPFSFKGAGGVRLPSDLQTATAINRVGCLAQFYTEALLRLQHTTHFGIHGSRKPWRQTRTYRNRPLSC